MIVYLVIIDDSNGQGYEEEAVYYEEEPQENFNHLSNQGKLTLATYPRKLILATKHYQHASLTCQITPLIPNPSFYLQA